MTGRVQVDEPESSHEGACSRYMMNRNLQMTGCGQDIWRIWYDVPESPDEGELESLNHGACLRYIMNPSRQMRGACLSYMMSPNRSAEGHVQVI